jgi:hypothetical protein
MTSRRAAKPSLTNGPRLLIRYWVGRRSRAPPGCAYGRRRGAREAAGRERRGVRFPHLVFRRGGALADNHPEDLTDRLQAAGPTGVRYIQGWEGLRLAKETKEMREVQPAGRGWSLAG